MASFQGREEAAERSPAEGLVLGLDSFSIFKDNLKSQACSDTKCFGYVPDTSKGILIQVT